ncbi:MAG TPA: hypothetical protein VIG79_13360 [Lapillicoccus sp.]|uniref:hypothetical protein n=1 Tax=Lapillicoccus sp. TaxID=1909287 RepID=UPI002F929DB9
MSHPDASSLSVSTHLRPDGTVFPPVTPEPPAPPGYVSPLDDAPYLDDLGAAPHADEADRRAPG